MPEISLKGNKEIGLKGLTVALDDIRTIVVGRNINRPGFVWTTVYLLGHENPFEILLIQEDYDNLIEKYVERYETAKQQVERAKRADKLETLAAVVEAINV